MVEIPSTRGPFTSHGCGGVGVSTADCGSASPGSIPGHGPPLQVVSIDVMAHPIALRCKVIAVRIVHSNNQ